MRTRITVDRSGMVTVRYTDEWGDPHAPVFYVGSDPGYIRRWDRDGAQVCRGLAGMGPTLRATRATLLATIRREYRRMRRAVSR